MSNQHPIIAGRHGGKIVRCVPAVHPVYQKLENAAQAGNHWAGVAVKLLQELTTGRLGKDNIYIKSTNMVARGNEEFYVFLPGIKVTAERLPNDEYKIVYMELDPGYFEAEVNAEPGLYKATFNVSRRWEAAPSPDGEIQNQPYRLVAITDTNHRTVGDAVKAAAKRIRSAPNAARGERFEDDGFDLYFTPGNKSAGGVLQKSALNKTDIHGAAVQLADIMLQAKEIQNVSWISEFGGSAILTQAMDILVKKNVTLDQHTVYLYRHKTSASESYQLAQKLKLKIGKEFASAGFFDPFAELSSAMVIPARLRSETDRYKAADAFKQVGGGFLKLSAATSVVAGVGLLTGGVAGASAPAMSAIMKALSVAGSASGAVSLGTGVYAWGKSLAEPHTGRLLAKK